MRAGDDIGIERSVFLYFVLDTNVVLDQLTLIQDLCKAIPNTTRVVVPWIVLQELDRLKTRFENPNGSSVRKVKYAQLANSWVYETLKQNNLNLRVQKLHEILVSRSLPDDLILDCCQYFAQNSQVVLMSNDRNLLAKALAHDIRTIEAQKDVTIQNILSSIAPYAINHNMDISMTDEEMSMDERSTNCKQLIEEIFETIMREWPSLFVQSYPNSDDYEYFQPPESFKSLSELLQFLEKRSFTFFTSLRHFPLRDLDRSQWLRFARTGLGVGPATNDQLTNWLKDLNTVWALLDVHQTSDRIELMSQMIEKAKGAELE